MNNTSIISLIVSHNSRIQCYIDKIKNDIYPGNDPKRKIRFKNGALLKLIIQNNKCYLSLIYEGNLGNKQPSINKPYWITENFDINIDNIDQQPTIIFPKIEVPITDINLNLIFGDKFVINFINPNTPYIFYIARHGEATHNTTKFNIRRDTSLTSLGESQVEKTGEILNNDLVNNLGNYKINYIFISDLERTRFTARNILFKVNLDNIDTNEMIILPCSHEINTKKSTGNCDIDERSTKFKLLKGFGSAQENYSKCNPSTLACTFINKNPDDDLIYNRINNSKSNNNNSSFTTINRYILNWKYYQKFYDNKMRGDYSQSSGREKCGENTMIGLALDIINGKREFLSDSIKSNEVKLSKEQSNSSRENNYAAIIGGKTKKKRSFNRRKKRQSYSKKRRY